MTHKEFLARLDPQSRTALTELCDGPGLRHLALYILCIAVFVALIALRVPMWWLAVAPLGVLWAFLFTLQHECTHQTPFRSAALTEAIGHVTGFILVQPFLWFRYFHLAHHRHTNDPAHDPELSGEKPESWGAYLLHLSSLGYWRDKARVLWTNAFEIIDAPYIPPRKKPTLRSEARVLLGLYTVAAVILLVEPGLFWIWPGPLLIGFPVLRFYLLAEHARCPAVANMFDNTRTTFTNRIVRFLAWNMPYHAEHHVYPNVPFHQLPELHGLTRAHLLQTEDGYAAFNARYVAGFAGQAQTERP